MVTQAIRSKAKDTNILSQLGVRYYEPDGAGVVYDDQFYLYNEYGEHMPERIFHSNLNLYILAVLRWLFRDRAALIQPALEYRIDHMKEGSELERRLAKVEPDLAVFIGQSIEGDEASFQIGEGKDLPPPDWLLETALPNTYKRDEDIKFRLYQDGLKAKEYILFDPHEKRLWKGSRLRGWRLVEDVYVPIKEQDKGRFWSESLQCWMVVEDRFLRLYDTEGNRLLTEAEYERAEKERERTAKEAALQRVAELEARLRALESGDSQ